MVEELLQKALTASNPAARGERSDFDLNHEGDTAHLVGEVVREAAVLVPLVRHATQTTILLTKRTENLNKHAGQVSFPGGALDDTDEDAIAAALRETHEEIGLTTDYIDVMGFLDTYRTGTGFQITPVVAMVQPGFELTLSPDEVADTFEVPLDFIMDRSNHERHSAVWRGRRRHYYAMPYDGYYIWGATAAMLVNLVDVLEAVREAS